MNPAQKRRAEEISDLLSQAAKLIRGYADVEDSGDGLTPNPALRAARLIENATASLDAMLEDER